MLGIERLECRAHLSTTKLVDAGGLPRQLTAVGDVVYFAVDSKADGHLSYVDLTAYNVKTKARASIRRDDGTRFGNVEYTLASVDNRLRITELLGKGKTAEWMLEPGDSKAKKFSAPKSPVSKDLATGFAATATPWANRTAFVSGRGVYTLNASTGKTYAINVPFEKHLDHIASLGAVGDKLIVDAVHKEGEKLYVVDRTTGVGARFRVSSLTGDGALVTVLPAGAILRANVGTDTRVFLSDGTAVGTKALTGSNASTIAFTGAKTPFSLSGLTSSSSFVQTDAHTVYFTAGGEFPPATDPERAGPYVAPTTGSVRTSADLISFVGSVPSYAVYRLDTSTSVVTVAASSLSQLGQLRLAGGAVYAMTDLHLLKRIELAAGGRVDDVGAAFDGPVFADGQPIFTPSATSSALVTFTPTRGTLRATLAWDGTTSFSPETPLYLDANQNGKYDSGEAVSAGGTLALDLKPGKYVVRINASPDDGWIASSGWTRSITVRAGQTSSAAFTLRDGLQNATGEAHAKTVMLRDTCWLDLDRDGRQTAADPVATFGSDGRARFANLGVGNYTLHYYAALRYTLQNPTGETTATLSIYRPGVTQSFDLY